MRSEKNRFSYTNCFCCFTDPSQYLPRFFLFFLKSFSPFAAAAVKLTSWSLTDAPQVLADVCAPSCTADALGFGGGDAEFQSFEILALLSVLLLSELLFFLFSLALLFRFQKLKIPATCWTDVQHRNAVELLSALPDWWDTRVNWSSSCCYTS